MRCEPICLLESDEGAGLELDDFLTRLRRCEGCPHASAEDPVVARLRSRCQDAARSSRRQRATIRKREHELAEALMDAQRYEGRIAKLESLQRVISDEIEAALAEERVRVREQEEEIEALSLPLIRIWEGVIALPIIGALTTTRARVLTERLLEVVERTEIRTPIIDVTGVVEIDMTTADHLIRMIRALRLLGAEPVLTGVTPDVAQALVALGIDLSDMTTERSVQEALRQSLLRR